MSNKNIIYITLLLSSLIAVFLFPVLFLGKTCFFRDLTYIFHPWRSYAAQMLQRGEMPLWNPFSYSGMPFLANWQSAVFYPFNILFYILPFSLALKIFYFINLFIAGFFTFLFAKKNGFKNISSIAMMLVSAFNGFLITKLEFLSHAGVDAWTFALLLFIREPVLLSLSAVIAFMAGHQIFAYQMMLLLFLMLIKDLKIGLKNLLIVFFISIGIAAVQLIPLLELMNYSNRLISGISSEVAMNHSLSFKGLIRLFYPLYNNSAVQLAAGEKFQWDSANYIGLTALLMAVVGLFTKISIKDKLIAVVLVIAGFILAFGSSTPIYPWLYKNFTAFNTTRYPAQFIFIAVTGLVLLIGYGFDALRKTTNRGMLLIIVCVIYLELLFYGQGFQPLADNNYFHNKHKLVEYMQKTGGERFILSPGSEKNRYVSGKDTQDVWQKTRGCLYSLTALPYHVFCAYGFGEPLTLQALELLVDEAYKQQTPQALLPYLSLLGTNYLICREKLAEPGGYDLVFSELAYIYKTKEYSKIYESAATVDILEKSPVKTVLNVFANSDTSLAWKESFMPGWKAYQYQKDRPGTINVKINKWNNIFREFKVPQGETKVIQHYDPLSYRTGVLITLFTVLLLLAFYFLKFRQYVL